MSISVCSLFKRTLFIKQKKSENINDVTTFPNLIIVNKQVSSNISVKSQRSIFPLYCYYEQVRWYTSPNVIDGVTIK